MHTALPTARIIPRLYLPLSRQIDPLLLLVQSLRTILLLAHLWNPLSNADFQYHRSILRNRMKLHCRLSYHRCLLNLLSSSRSHLPIVCQTRTLPKIFSTLCPLDLCTDRGPAIHTVVEFPPVMPHIRGYASSLPSQNNQFDHRYQEYQSNSISDNKLDPVSALLMAAENVDRNERNNIDRRGS